MRIMGCLVVCVAAWMMMGAPAAQAKKRASAAQSAAMWKVVDPGDRCRHTRGWISTAKTRDAYGTVVIANVNCGNGQAVLRRKAGRWSIRGQGSDWGSLDRCNADLRRIPATVMRDLFSRNTCRRYTERACGTIPTVTEGVPASERVYGAGLSCEQARELLQTSNDTGVRPEGWDCLGSGEGVLCVETNGTDISMLAGNDTLLRYYRRVRGDLTVIAAASRSCRNVIMRVNGAVYARTYGLQARRVGCTTARRVARGWLEGAEGTVDTPRPLRLPLPLRRRELVHLPQGLAGRALVRQSLAGPDWTIVKLQLESVHSKRVHLSRLLMGENAVVLKLCAVLATFAAAALSLASPAAAAPSCGSRSRVAQRGGSTVRIPPTE